MHGSTPSQWPNAFCWTRFGPEAGETFDDILRRKELERSAGNGRFFWGIGSAIGPALSLLVNEVQVPEVLFSPIRSKPRAVDVEPDEVVRWTAGIGLDGEITELPETATVTSRWDPRRPQTARFALVCSSDAPLQLESWGTLDFAALRNLRSGSPLGASQVTAVVRHERRGIGAGNLYPVSLRVALTWPFLVRLQCPVVAGTDRPPRPAGGARPQLSL